MKDKRSINPLERLEYNPETGGYDYSISEKEVEEAFEEEVRRSLEMSNFEKLHEQSMKDLILYGRCVIKDNKEVIHPFSDEANEIIEKTNEKNKENN